VAHHSHSARGGRGGPGWLGGCWLASSLLAGPFPTGKGDRHFLKQTSGWASLGALNGCLRQPRLPNGRHHHRSQPLGAGGRPAGAHRSCWSRPISRRAVARAAASSAALVCFSRTQARLAIQSGGGGAGNRTWRILKNTKREGAGVPGLPQGLIERGCVWSRRRRLWQPCGVVPLVRHEGRIPKGENMRDDESLGLEGDEPIGG